MQNHPVSQAWFRARETPLTLIRFRGRCCPFLGRLRTLSVQLHQVTQTRHWSAKRIRPLAVLQRDKGKSVISLPQRREIPFYGGQFFCSGERPPCCVLTQSALGVVRLCACSCGGRAAPGGGEQRWAKRSSGWGGHAAAPTLVRPCPRKQRCHGAARWQSLAALHSCWA
jgi:hypothetical protein